MNRRTDPEDFDASHLRHDYCLKEKEWREIHDFIAGTPEHRRGVDRRLESIEKSVANIENKLNVKETRLWQVACVLLVPIATSLFWTGSIAKQVEINTQRWDKVLEGSNLESPRVRA